MLNYWLMLLKLPKNSLTAVFLATLLLFNLSGSLCLAHCQWMDMNSKKEFCPLAKMDKNNCPKAKKSLQKDAKNFASTESRPAMGCCELNISFFAAHFEKQQSETEKAEKNKETPTNLLYFEFKKSNRTLRPPDILPPIYDKRVERIKFSVFQI